MPCSFDDVLASVKAGSEVGVSAILKEHPEWLDKLDKYGITPLSLAAMNGHVAVVKTLVQLGSQALDTPDKYGCTPLFRAAMYGNIYIIETLIRLGSQALDTSNRNGDTPLSWAVRDGYLSAAKTLVALGADSRGVQIEHPTEDFMHQVRFRVYFAESLVGRSLRHLP